MATTKLASRTPISPAIDRGKHARRLVDSCFLRINLLRTDLPEIAPETVLPADG